LLTAYDKVAQATHSAITEVRKAAEENGKADEPAAKATATEEAKPTASSPPPAVPTPS
jgi:hypothetical protein